MQNTRTGLSVLIFSLLILSPVCSYGLSLTLDAIKAAPGAAVITPNANKTPQIININKCTVTDGKRSDRIFVSGKINPTIDSLNSADFINIAIDGPYMGKPLVLSIPINRRDYNKTGKYAYSGTNENGVRKFFKLDLKTHKFSFSAQKLDLSGLSCPVNVRFDIADYKTNESLDEAIVNGPGKFIPISLLTGIENSLRVDKFRFRPGNNQPLTDTLTFSGGFSIKDKNSDMSASVFNINPNLPIVKMTMHLKLDDNIDLNQEPGSVDYNLLKETASGIKVDLSGVKDTASASVPGKVDRAINFNNIYPRASVYGAIRVSDAGRRALFGSNYSVSFLCNASDFRGSIIAGGIKGRSSIDIATLFHAMGYTDNAAHSWHNSYPVPEQYKNVWALYTNTVEQEGNGIRLKMYVNGKRYVSEFHDRFSLSEWASRKSPDYPEYLGLCSYRFNQDIIEGFGCVLDELRIYKGILSKADIYNLCNEFGIVYEGDNTPVSSFISLPASSFKANRNKTRFTCSKVPSQTSKGIVSGWFDLNRSTFSLTIRQTKINDINNLANLNISFKGFNKEADISKVNNFFTP